QKITQTRQKTTIPYLSAIPPSELMNSMEVTQGSAFLATLGSGAESLRDSPANPEGIEPSSPGLRARELPWDPAFQKAHQPRMRLCPFPAINPKRNAGVHLCNIPATE